MQFSIKAVAFVLLTCLCAIQCFCQGLESIPPILRCSGSETINTGVSFILTPGQKMEIIDASQPWPPRWFAKVYSENGVQDSNHYQSYSDARFQSGYFTYTNKPLLSERTDSEGYIICNKKMEPVDTIKGVDLPVNPHDFRINNKNEKLFIVRQDTFLNLSALTGNAGDTGLESMVDIIEVIDRHDKLIFRWNPVCMLGVNAHYTPYGGLVSASSRTGIIDWSHANSVDWDFDGNILYSFRHIGIGKISRKDGHVIWRLDRNKMPYMNGKDTLAFYLQHGFEKAIDYPDYSTYVLFSSGDSSHPGSFGLEFSIDKRNYNYKVIQKKLPVGKVFSIAAGNYQVTKNGDYIINDGGLAQRDDKNETSGRKKFLEYGNTDGKIYAEYCMLTRERGMRVYKVNMLDNRILPRPEIKLHKNLLFAIGEMKNWTWYQLTGPDNTQVKKVGTGKNFTPPGSGTYCVAGKYGIGWAVSPPFLYKL